MDFIPDIFRLASATDYQAGQSSLWIHLTEAHGLQVGDTVRLIVDEQGQVDKEVIAMATDANSFTVGEWAKPADKIFVYGKQVHDFRSIDHDRILMLCISAIQIQQQQHRQLQAENEALNAKVAGLELLIGNC